MAGGTRRGGVGGGRGLTRRRWRGGTTWTFPPRQDVDERELDQRRKHEDETNDHPDVDRLTRNNPHCIVITAPPTYSVLFYSSRTTYSEEEYE